MFSYGSELGGKILLYANYGGTLYDWNQLYPHITAAIREVDANTPILIGGMAYSAVEWLPYLEPTGDPYTVYTVHQYEPIRNYSGTLYFAINYITKQPVR